MLASWVKDSTTTTGTGTITLAGSPASGYIGFDDAFSSTDIVHYTIEDGSNRETGVGTLTSGASWTLSRDTILETLSSGTYSRMPASGISLSGSATVGISPNGGIIQAPYKGYLAGSNYRMPSGTVGTYGNTTAVTADRLYVSPFVLSETTKITSIHTYVFTNDAAATISRLGLYTSDVDGLPDRLLIDGSIDVTTTGGKTVTPGTPVDVPPGTYWFAFASDQSPSIRTQPIADIGHIPMTGNMFLNPALPYKTLSSWSALPDPFGTPTSTSTSTVIVIGYT